MIYHNYVSLPKGIWRYLYITNVYSKLSKIGCWEIGCIFFWYMSFSVWCIFPCYLLHFGANTCTLLNFRSKICNVHCSLIFPCLYYFFPLCSLIYPKFHRFSIVFIEFSMGSIVFSMVSIDFSMHNIVNM